MSATVFSKTLNTNATANGYGVRMACLGIKAGGTKLKLTFASSTAAGLAVNNVSVGVQAPASSPVATVATPVEALFSGGHGFSIAANSTIQSDEISLTCSVGDTLVVIVDLAGSGANFRYASASTDMACYYKAATSSYSTANPSLTGWTLDYLCRCLSQIDITDSDVSVGTIIFDKDFLIASSTADTTDQSTRQLCESLSAGGSQVRATLYSGSSGALVLKNASVGVQTTTYNTSATPIELKFGGASGVTIGGKYSSKASDLATLTFLSTDTLVVVMDSQSGYFCYLLGGTEYYKASTTSYNEASPSGSWSNTNLWSVKRLQLAGVEGGSTGGFKPAWIPNRSQLIGAGTA